MSVDETDDGRPDRPDITRLLPRYGLLRQLSSTLMSEVFRARDRVLDIDVALKVIRPELMRQPAFASRFRRETKIAAALRHPHIVPVYDTGEVGEGDDALGYLAMRFVRGATLGRVIAERGRLDLDETVVVARQIAAALDAAHAQGLVHRDVKPANVLVEAATNQYYLCDFGIAKSTAESTVTATGAAVGSALYWSPEQQAGSRDLDHRSDVYSFGCVLYDCLAGLAPSALRAQRTRQDVTHSQAVDRVLRKAMSVDPAQRHASCGELADDLAEAARTTHRQRRLVTAGRRGAVGLVAVLALLVFLLVPGQGDGQDDLTRIPVALRDGCENASRTAEAASVTLSCTDRAGHTVVTSLFPGADAATRAYGDAVERLDATRSRGDCARDTEGEHRYPATGAPLGRVACRTRDGTLTLVWLDERNRTMNRAESADAADLRQAWAGWTGGEEPFPTAEERGLVDVAAGTTCVRAEPADLDAYSAATAAVTCVPRGSGARSVTYYRFASRTALREGLTARVKTAEAGSGEGCVTSGEGEFLGTGRHDWLGTDLGQVLCTPDSDGTLRITWSMEPMLVAGTVTGVDRAALTGWWSQWHLAPLSRIVDALNAQSSPPFPSKAERALLEHVPAVSRINCVRTSSERVWGDVGAADVTSVVCGPTSGAGTVAYYQFENAAAMRAAYNDTGGSSPQGSCTDPSKPFGSYGPYERGGRDGRISCGTFGGDRFMSWTDNRRAIAVYASDGRQPFAMIDWWRYDAGPK